MASSIGFSAGCERECRGAHAPSPCILSRLIITTFRSREGLLRKEEATEDAWKLEGKEWACAASSACPLYWRQSLHIVEGVPLWTAELNDLTVPESAEARE